MLGGVKAFTAELQDVSWILGTHMVESLQSQQSSELHTLHSMQVHLLHHTRTQALNFLKVPVISRDLGLNESYKLFLFIWLYFELYYRNLVNSLLK